MGWGGWGWDTTIPEFQKTTGWHPTQVVGWTNPPRLRREGSKGIHHLKHLFHTRVTQTSLALLFCSGEGESWIKIGDRVSSLFGSRTGHGLSPWTPKESQPRSRFSSPSFLTALQFAAPSKCFRDGILSGFVFVFSPSFPFKANLCTKSNLVEIYGSRF